MSMMDPCALSVITDIIGGGEVSYPSSFPSNSLKCMLPNAMTNRDCQWKGTVNRYEISERKWRQKRETQIVS